MGILYPAGYKGEPVKPVSADRTPTEKQRSDCKAFVDTLVGGTPKDYNALLAPIEKAFPHVFTDAEKVALLEELNEDRDPEKVAAKKAAEEPIGSGGEK